MGARGGKGWAPEVRGAEELTVQVEAHERLRGGKGRGGGGQNEIMQKWRGGVTWVGEARALLKEKGSHMRGAGAGGEGHTPPLLWRGAGGVFMVAGGVIGEMASRCGGMKAKRNTSLKEECGARSKILGARGARRGRTHCAGRGARKAAGEGGGKGGKQRVMPSGEGARTVWSSVPLRCANARSGVGGLERGRRLQIRTCTKEMRQKPGEGRWI